MTTVAELEKAVKVMAEDMARMQRAQVKMLGCIVQVQTAFYAVRMATQGPGSEKINPALDELYKRIQTVIQVLKGDEE